MIDAKSIFHDVTPKQVLDDLDFLAAHGTWGAVDPMWVNRYHEMHGTSHTTPSMLLLAYEYIADSIRWKHKNHCPVNVPVLIRFKRNGGTEYVVVVLVEIDNQKYIRCCNTTQLEPIHEIQVDNQFYFEWKEIN